MSELFKDFYDEEEDSKKVQRILSGFSDSKTINKPEQQGYAGDLVDAFQSGAIGSTGDIAQGATLGKENFVSKGLHGLAQSQYETMQPESVAAMQNTGLDDNLNIKEGSSLRGVGLLGAQALGSIAPSIIPGALIGKGLQAAGLASKAIGTGLGHAATGAAMIGGSTANQVQQDIESLTPEQLGKDNGFGKIYWDYRNKGIDSEEAFSLAKKDYKDSLSQQAFNKGAPIGAVSMGLGNPILEKVIAGKAGTTRLANIVAGAATESTQEFGENYGQQIAVNKVAKQNYDPSRNITEGALGQAATGALIGGGVGGGIGGLTFRPTLDNSVVDAAGTEQTPTNQGLAQQVKELPSIPQDEIITFNDGSQARKSEVVNELLNQGMTQDEASNYVDSFIEKLKPKDNTQENLSLNDYYDLKDSEAQKRDKIFGLMDTVGKQKDEVLKARTELDNTAIQSDNSALDNIEQKKASELVGNVSPAPTQFTPEMIRKAEKLGSVGDAILERGAIKGLTNSKILQELNSAIKETPSKTTSNDKLNVTPTEPQQPSGQSVQQFEKPAYKVRPNAQAIVDNRTVKPGLGLKDVINKQYQNDGSYNPLAGKYEKPSFKMINANDAASDINIRDNNDYIISGLTWDDIKNKQQGKNIAKIINNNSEKPKATQNDIDALNKIGVKGLKKQQLFGVLDRLNNSGFITDEEAGKVKKQNSFTPTHEDKQTNDLYQSIGNGKYRDENGDVWDFNDGELQVIQPATQQNKNERVITTTQPTNKANQNETRGKESNTQTAGETITKPGVHSGQSGTRDTIRNRDSGSRIQKSKERPDAIDSGDSQRHGVSTDSELAGHQANAGTEQDGGRGTGKNELLPGDSGTDAVGRNNFSLTDKPNIELTPAKRRDVNNKAIEILQKPVEDITEADKEVLRQYTGAGGLSAQDSVDKGDAIFNQHYTDYSTIKSIYGALDNAGFKPKRILEPSVGSGNFIGHYPNAKWDAVDIDKTNTEIVKRLYPDANVSNESYETFKGKNYDLIVSNVPFASFSALPRQHANTIKPAFKAIHNFFFAHSLDKLKPNGVMAFMTSTGTMDGTGEAKRLRSMLVKKADVIGAYRLPMGTQKKNASTEVMIDIIYLQKRPEGATPSQEQLKKNIAFTHVVKHEGYPINEYFVKYPDSVLGDLHIGKNKTAMGKVGWIVTGEPDYSKINVKLNDYSKPKQSSKSKQQNNELVFDDAKALNDYLVKNNHKERAAKGSEPFFKDGYFYNKPVSFRNEEGQWLLGRKLTGINAGKMALLKKIHDTIDQNLVEQYKKRYKVAPHDDKKLKDWAKAHKADKVLKSYLALFDKDFNLSEIFTEQVRFKDSGKLEVTKDSPLTGRAEAEENADGLINIDSAKLISPDEVKQLLDSGKYAQIDNTHIQNAWLYYAGNIYKKLDDLNRISNKQQREKQRKKLEQVKPKLIPFERITITGKESWLPIEVKDALGISKNNDGEFVVNEGLFESGYYRELYQNYLNNKPLVKKHKDDTQEEHNDKIKDAQQTLHDEVLPIIKQKIADEALTDLVVDKYNRSKNFFAEPQFDGSSLKDLPKTFRGKPFKLMEHQQKGVERAIYNKKGVIAFAPGLGKTPTAIIVIKQLLQKGVVKKPLFIVPANTIPQWEETARELYPDAKIFEFPKYTRGVNKGKPKDWQSMTAEDKEKMVHDLANNRYDYVFISTNLAQKFTIPKEKLERYVDDLVNTISKMEKPDDELTKSQLKAKQQRLAKIEMLKTTMMEAYSKDAEAGFDMEKLGFDAIVADEVQAYKNIGMQSEEARGGIGANVAINAVYPKDKDGKPNKLQDPIKVSLDSARSYDFRFKTQYISENNNGNNVFLLTGTPTPNKPLELMTLLQHLDVNILKEYGIENASDFVDEFLDVSETESTDVAGKTKMRPELTGISNIDALKKIITRYVDYLPPEAAKDLKRPKQINVNHTILRNDTAESVFHDIQTRLINAIKDAKDKRQGNDVKDLEPIIKLYLAGRDASIDTRLYTPSNKGDLFKPGDKSLLQKETREDYSKIAKTVSLIAKRLSENPDAGQLVFLDRLKFPNGQGSTHAEIRDEILAKTDLKPEHVVFVNAQEHVNPATGKVVKSGPKPERLQAIIDAYNAGDIKVVIGNTAKLGVGVDLQKYTTDIYMIDKPYRPDEIEQRINRGVRQGNVNDKVVVHTFNMPGSFDELSDRIVANKQGFNDVFWKKQEGDTAEIATQEAPDAYEAAIAIETDPVKRRGLEIERDISQANQKKQSIESKISSLAKREKTIIGNIKEREDAIKRADNATTPEYSALSGQQKTEAIKQFREKLNERKEKYKTQIKQLKDDLSIVIKDKKQRQDELEKHNQYIKELRDKYVVNGRVSLESVKEKGNVKLSKSKDAARVWIEIASNDDLFQYKKTSKKTLVDIANEISKNYKVIKTDIKPDDVKNAWIVLPKNSNNNDNKNNKRFIIEYNDGSVEVNVAQSKTGEGGAEIYAIAGAYAHNNGLIFNKDRFGLTRTGKKRRIENLLSLALKYGTTDFIGMPDDNIEWTEKNSIFNIASLLKKSLQNTRNSFSDSSWFDSTKFDFKTGEFKNGNDEVITDSEYKKYAKQARENGFSIGKTTIKRAIFTKEIISRARNDREVLGFLDSFLSGNIPESLKGIAYSKGTKTGSTVNDVESWIPKRVKKRLNKNIKVVQSVTDLPEHIQNGISGVEGLYDSSINTVYLVADMLNKDNINAVLAHELLHARLAQDAKLREQLDSAKAGLRTIFDGIKKGTYKGRYKDLYEKAMSRVSSAKTSPDDEFEEFMAYAVTAFNDNPQSLPVKIKRIIQNIISAIKTTLMKYGFPVSSLTPSDLNYLALGAFRNSNTSIQQSSLKYSKSIKDLSGIVNAFSREKLSQDIDVENEVEKYGVFNGRLGKIGDLTTKYLTTLDNLARNNKVVRPFIDKAKTMQEYKDEILSKTNDIAIDAYLSLGKKGIKSLFSGDTPAQKRLSDAIFTGTLKNEIYDDNALRSNFNLRPNEIKAYKQIRKYMDEVTNEYKESMLYRLGVGVDKTTGDIFVIEPSGNAKKDQAKLDAALSVIDQFKGLKGYFPLMRFGNHTITVKDAEGEVVYFAAEETKAKAIEHANRVNAEYKQKSPDFKTSLGLLSESSKDSLALDPRLLTVLADVSKNDPQFSDILDEAEQQILKMFTNSEFKKRFIHRKNILGFNKDLLRTIASYGWSSSNYISKMKYMGELQQIVDSIDKHKYPKTVEHLNDTLEYIKSAKNEYNGIKAFTFMYYMGLNVKSAFVNLTQIPVTLGPFLANKFGDVRTASILKDAMPESARFDVANPRGDIGRILLWAHDEGLTFDSYLGELIGIAQGNRYARTRTINKAVQSATLLFSKAEQFNRRTTVASAYLAVKDMSLNEINGLLDEFGYSKQNNKEAAVKEFVRLAVTKTQFDYAKFNKPAAFRGLASVPMQFKQFLVNYIQFIAGNGGGMGATLRSLSAVALMSGLMGLPGADDFKSAIEYAYNKLTGKYLDIELEGRKALVSLSQQFMDDDSAKMFAQAVLNGVPSMTPFDISYSVSVGRILPGMAGFFNRAVTHGELEGLGEIFMDLAGPTAGIAKKVARGIEEAEKSGDVMRLVEKSPLPVAVQNLVKALRVANAGVDRNYSGKVSIAYEPTVLDSIAQALSFSQGERNRLYKLKNAQYRESAFLKLAHQKLITRLSAAMADKDTDKIREAREEIREWNKEVPRKWQLSQSKINRSIRARMKHFDKATQVKNKQLQRSFSENAKLFY